MAYRLSLSDDLATSVRACAREELEGAIAQLEGGPGAKSDPARAVHEARKHLKKSRSLLRLVRPALGTRTYRRENEALRDAARQLSATRDADVLVATVDKLAEREAGQLPASDFDGVRAALVAEAAAGRAAAPAAAGDGDAPVTAAEGGGDPAAPLTGAASPRAADGEAAVAAAAGAVAAELHAALGRIDGWRLRRAGWETVVAGISRGYARGFEEREAVLAASSVEALHDWRKRVKDLWYHHRLLRDVWPPVMDAYGEEAHVLSEVLGDDHDLAVLRDRLQDGIELPAGAAADLEPLLALVDARRAELQAQARAIGDRLYAEPPRTFTRRLDALVARATAGPTEAG